jgi:hypothetical protein
MTSVEPDDAAVRQALDHASERAAGLVRAGGPLDGRVPGLEWTKAQLVGHLVAICAALATRCRVALAKIETGARHPRGNAD